MQIFSLVGLVLGRWAAAAALAALSACGSLPEDTGRTPSWASHSSADSRLAEIARASTPDPSLTGFRLIPLGSYALDARVQLAERAERTLDIQYYLLADDPTGRIVLRSLRDAALRGVRVRLLVDDLYTAGHDELFQDLATVPNVEVRLFNPFCCGRHSIAAKYIASLLDFGRIDHRMHNKLYLADGAMAVMGGRNIADEYFTRSATDNFVDMDVLVVGAAVDQLQNIFDAYWNSDPAYAIATVVGGPADASEARRRFDRRVEGEVEERSLPFVDILGHGPVRNELDDGRLQLVWGRAMAFADDPAKVSATAAEAARLTSVQMNILSRAIQATREVILSSPYFIPGRAGLDDLIGLRERGVHVAVLTNSLASTDVPQVHAGYARYRKRLLAAGVQLFELSPTRLGSGERLELPGMSLGRLHAKAAVIDRSTVYIGSMNLDPRSESTNTELGILVDCPALATDVVRVIEATQLKSAYRVRLGTTGGLQWTAPADDGGATVDDEPEITRRDRLLDGFLAHFVPEQLL